jgi:hypothetical protein
VHDLADQGRHGGSCGAPTPRKWREARGWHRSCSTAGVSKVTTLPERPGSVLVVSSNPETLDGLTQYFSKAGVPSESRRCANPLAELPRALSGLVVFPDDYIEHEIANYLFMVRTRRPGLTIVVVSRDAQAYRAMTTVEGHPLHAVVLARPAFGWAILDAIRSAPEAT